MREPFSHIHHCSFKKRAHRCVLFVEFVEKNQLWMCRHCLFELGPFGAKFRLPDDISCRNISLNTRIVLMILRNYPHLKSDDADVVLYVKAEASIHKHVVESGRPIEKTGKANNVCPCSPNETDSFNCSRGVIEHIFNKKHPIASLRRMSAPDKLGNLSFTRTCWSSNFLLGIDTLFSPVESEQFCNCLATFWKSAQERSLAR